MLPCFNVYTNCEQAADALGQEVGEFLQRLLLEASLLPQVRCQEVVCGLQSCEGGLRDKRTNKLSTLQSYSNLSRAHAWHTEVRT